MDKRIKIEQAECDKVESLFMQFNAYCSILGYLANYGSIDNEKFDKKWSEAVALEIELDKLKSKLDAKYHPTEGQYLQYNFDFDHSEMVYHEG